MQHIHARHIRITQIYDFNFSKYYSKKNEYLHFIKYRGFIEC